MDGRTGGQHEDIKTPVTAVTGAEALKLFSSPALDTSALDKERSGRL